MNVGEIITIIQEVGLSLPPAFQHETPMELSCFYNGVGADWFPERLRRAVTMVLERMEPLAFIHDVEFGTAPRSYMAFTRAQLRWVYNAAKLALFFYREHRLRFFIAATLCAVCCQFGGWRGYKSEDITK